jgi:hypothetical protein
MSLLGTFLRGGWKPGLVPKGARQSLEEEGVLFLEEELPGTISYLSYSRVAREGPATYPAVGAIAVSRQRFVVWAGRYEYIDIATGHPIRDTVTVTVDEPGQVCFSYPADDYSPGRTGTVEVRLRTAQAAKIDLLLNR